MKALKPGAREPREDHADLTTSFTVLNKFFNALAYNPPGAAEGYLFYALWLNHIGASVYSTQDALRPDPARRDPDRLRRGRGARERREDRQPAGHADRPDQLPEQRSRSAESDRRRRPS